MKVTSIAALAIVLSWTLALTTIATLVSAQAGDDKSETLMTGGTTLINELMKKLLTTYKYIHPDQKIEFHAISSSRGTCRALDYANLCEPGDVAHPREFDFAISVTPLFQEYIDLYDDAETVPMFGMPVVPVYNIPGIPENETLVLDPHVLTRIFRKCTPDPLSTTPCDPTSIHFWNDPDIVATNPQWADALDAAGEIAPIVRKGVWGSNIVMKSSIASVARNYTDFAAQVPIDETDNYGTNVSHVWPLDTQQIYITIRAMPGTIAVIPQGDAIRENLRMVSLKVGDELKVPLPANRFSVDVAAAERSTVSIIENQKNFKNLHEIELKAGGWGAKSVTGWPLMGFQHFIFRSRRVREGTNCGVRAIWIEFVEWLLTNERAAEIIHDLGYSLLSPQATTLVIDQLKSILQCENGQYAVDFKTDGSNQKSYNSIVYVGPTPDAVTLLTSAGVNGFNDGRRQGEKIDLVKTEDTVGDLKGNLDRPGSIAVYSSPDHEITLGDDSADFVTLPFGAVAGGIIYNLCDPMVSLCPAKNVQLTLGISTIADILNGDILFWNDTRIATYLKPSDAAKLPNEPITVLQPVDGWDTNFAEVIKIATAGEKTVTYAGGSVKPASFINAEALILGKKFSIALIPAFTATIPYATVVYKSKEDLNVFVSPNTNDTNACIRHFFNAKTKKFEIEKVISETSIESDEFCYPIILPVYISTRRSYTQSQCVSGGGIIAAKFMQRFFGLSDSEFFLGNEVYVNKSASEESLNFKTVYADLNANRIARSGVIVTPKSFNMGTLAVPMVRDDVSKIRAGYMEEIESINCDGVSIVQNHQHLNEISIELKYTAIAFTVFCGAVILGIGAWVIRYREARIVKNNSPLFLIQILIGAALGVISITLFPVDDIVGFDYHDVEGGSVSQAKSIQCNTAFALAALGYGIMVSALYVKMWRIVRIFINPRLSRFTVTNGKLLVYQLIFVLIFVLEIVIGYLVAPLQFVRRAKSFNPIDGNIVESYGTCESEMPEVSYIPFFVTMLITVVYGNYLAYQSRDIPNEFSEGKWMAIALLAMLQGLLFGLPVILLTETSNPTVSYLAKALMLIILFCIAPSFLFVPKFLLAYGCIKSKDDALKISNSASKIASSKEKNVGSGNAKSGGNNSREGSANAPRVKSNKDFAAQSSFNGRSHTPTVGSRTSLKKIPSKETMPVVTMGGGIILSILPSSPENSSKESSGEGNNRMSVELSNASNSSVTDVDADRLRVAPWLMVSQNQQLKKNEASI